MRKNSENSNKNQVWRKPLAMAASFAVCICVMGVTALAANGQLQGFFKDKTNWNGAVVGTTYEQATDEIEVAVVGVTNGSVELQVMLKNPNAAPYRYIELFGVDRYRILDMNGDAVMEASGMERSSIREGQVNLSINVEELPEGTYVLEISSFVGEKKADQPLPIKGLWECEFVK